MKDVKTASHTVMLRGTRNRIYLKSDGTVAVKVGDDLQLILSKVWDEAGDILLEER